MTKMSLPHRVTAVSALTLAALSPVAFSATASSGSLTLSLSPTQDTHRYVLNVDTSGLPSFTIKAPRTMGDTTQPTLVCEQDGQQHEVEWDTPLECDQLTWPIEFEKVGEHGLEVAEQTNRFSAEQQWFLLSEWNSLPSFWQQGAQLETTLCLTQQDTCYEMPTTNEAPMLLSWGLPEVRISANNAHFDIASDVTTILEDRDSWYPTFKQQLGYLTTIFESAEPLDWQINIFGKEIESGSVSGAAGFSAINVNVPLQNGQLHDQSYPHLLKIMAHEAIHGLETQPHALWIRESLAEYYAQKSLVNTAFAAPSAIEQWQTLSERLPFAATGVIEANRALIEENQQHNYMLFYTKAVAFWHALDRELTEHDDSLDNYLNQPFSKQGYELDNKLVAGWKSVIGEDNWLALERDYLATTN